MRLASALILAAWAVWAVSMAGAEVLPGPTSEKGLVLAEEAVTLFSRGEKKAARDLFKTAEKTARTYIDLGMAIETARTLATLEKSVGLEAEARNFLAQAVDQFTEGWPDSPPVNFPGIAFRLSNLALDQSALGGDGEASLDLISRTALGHEKAEDGAYALMFMGQALAARGGERKARQAFSRAAVKAEEVTTAPAGGAGQRLIVLTAIAQIQAEAGLHDQAEQTLILAKKIGIRGPRDQEILTMIAAHLEDLLAKPGLLD